MADPLDDLMKKYPMPKSGGIAGTVPNPPASTRSFFGGDDPDTRSQRDVPSFLETVPSVGRGIAKGGAILATDLGRLASHALPSSVRQSVGGSRIGSAISDFADQDYQDAWEQGASYLTQGASMLMGPGDLGLGSKLSSLAGRWWPNASRAVYAGPRLGWIVNPNIARTQRTAAKAGRWVEGTAKGAAAGALADPDDPSAGAVIGGTTAGLLPMASAALRSRALRRAGGFALPSAATGAAIHLGAGLGLPKQMVIGAAIHNIRWHSSPAGRVLYRWGRYLTDRTGKMVGEISAPLAGYGAGSLMEQASPPIPQE